MSSLDSNSPGVIRIEVRGEVAHVTFSEPILVDERLLMEFDHAATQLLNDHRKVLLDLRRVEMMGSTILGMIVSINRGLRQRGGQLRLANVGPSVEDCFRVSRLDALLAIHPTEDEALQAFG